MDNKKFMKRINVSFFRLLKPLAFKPESFTYFSSSGIFYVNGYVCETYVNNDNILLSRGTSAQLLFDSTVANFDRERLFRGEILSVHIEPYAREGRGKPRLTVTHFDEDHLWRDL